jgi:hypothetical protein
MLHKDEIIRVADEFPGALAISSAFAPLPVRSHLLAPLPVEMIVQRGQGDIGEQRRENSALCAVPDYAQCRPASLVDARTAGEHCA